MSDGYIAIKPCGCVTKWVSSAIAAGQIGTWVADGYRVEPVSNEGAKLRIGFCAEHRAARRERAVQGALL